MQAFGVWSAVLLGTGLLLAGCVLVERPGLARSALILLIAAVSGYAGLHDRQRTETAYADYVVVDVSREGLTAPRAFGINRQTASLLDRSEPPRYARYIEHMRRILQQDLAFRQRDILVLGAGGFTLSHREPEGHANRYTYVDIDPAIRGIAERDFLRGPINGEFVVTDARRYVATSERRYDAVVVDVFTDQTAIPGHLVTREFWLDVRRALKADGVVLVNLILDGRLASDYARNTLATIESALGRCAVEVLSRTAEDSNVVVSCVPSRLSAAPQIYVDELNAADIDAARRR
jgi:hypothetical protein